MKKTNFLKTLLVAVCVLAGVNVAWATDVPTPVYFNDFSSTTGLTIQGTGSFTTDADARFGQVFSNAASAKPRTNYLLLPSSVFSAFTDEGGKTAMTISFWVSAKNAGAANAYTYAPLFAAYSAAPNPSSGNGLPMICLQSRGLMQINNNGWCDFVPAQNKDGKNNVYNTNAWEVDGNHTTEYTSGGNWLDDSNWHLYTMTLTASQATIYLDGVLKNQWNLDGSDGQYVSGMFTKSATNLTYVCLGGNQAWNNADNDAAFMFDDFAVYDAALTPAQIEKIIDTKLGYTTVTYDIDALSAVGDLTLAGTKSANAKTTDMFLPTNCAGLMNRFVFQKNDTWNINASGLGNTNTAKGRHFAILSMNDGDKLAITYIDSDGSTAAYAKSRNVGAFASLDDYTLLTSGQYYSVSSGIAMIETRYGARVSEIKIKTTATETMTAPSISSEASGSARTVTITDGTSSLFAPVTTYYTTDGSTPTASSTEYTAPFDVTETTTIKAITISNSSAETASAVTEELIDMDAVDVPTAAITAVDGVNRTVTFSCTTEGAELSYSTDNGETYTAGTSLVISKNTNIKVKATKGLVSSESENTLFEAGTSIKLNNPTYSIGAYSEGKYTLTLTSNQTNKLLSPVAVVKYTVNNGEIQTMNSGETVEAAVGSTYKFWSNATGYDNSDEVKVIPSYIDLSSYRTDWAMDLDALAMAIATTTNTSASLTKSGDELVSGYYNITDEGFNAKFGVNNVDWQVRNYGSGKSYNTGLWPYNVSGSMVITALSAGDVIIFTGDAVTAGTNVTKDAFLSTANSNSTFVVTADGNATFTPTKSGYIHSLTVYTQRPATVSATIGSTGWTTFASPYALDLSAMTASTGDVTAYYASTVTGGYVKMTETNKADVKAGEGLALHGTPSAVITIPVVASGTAIDGNLLKGCTTETVLSQNDDYYVLVNNNGTAEFQCLAERGATIPAGKAYLDAPTAGARLSIVFDDDVTTGLGRIENSESSIENAVYNLQGQRINSSLRKGLYIKNGKKMIVK